MEAGVALPIIHAHPEDADPTQLRSAPLLLCTPSPLPVPPLVVFLPRGKDQATTITVTVAIIFQLGPQLREKKDNKKDGALMRADNRHHAATCALG